jgi:rhodanese-related sulfurtransferase
MSDSQIPSISVHDVVLPITDAVTVLDVREDSEWAAGHIDGAQHIPLGDLPARLGEIDAERPIQVVCHLGGRSARATAWLQAQGYNASNVDGGMDAWQAAGRPVAL